jgi:hypothetical protein
MCVIGMYKLGDKQSIPKNSVFPDKIIDNFSRVDTISLYITQIKSQNVSCRYNIAINIQRQKKQCDWRLDTKLIKIFVELCTQEKNKGRRNRAMLPSHRQKSAAQV